MTADIILPPLQVCTNVCHLFIQVEQKITDPDVLVQETKSSVEMVEMEKEVTVAIGTGPAKTQGVQKMQSNVPIRASESPLGRPRTRHSQLGRMVRVRGKPCSGLKKASLYPASCWDSHVAHPSKNKSSEQDA